MGAVSDWYSVAVHVIIDVASYNIEPRYDDIRLYVIKMSPGVTPHRILPW